LKTKQFPLVKNPLP